MNAATLISVQDNQSTASEHRITLAGGEWSLWKWVVVRGAGFPSSQVLNLAAPSSTVALDELFHAEEQWLAVKTDALQLLSQELDNLRAKGLWQDRDRRTPLMKALKLLSKGKVPELGDQFPGLSESLARMRLAALRRNDAERHLQTTFASDQEKISRSIVHVARDRRFREAVTWQNRYAVHSGIHPLIQNSLDKRSNASKHRQHEEMVASYLQRYCVKNDTIGFFGPVGWALLTPQPKAINAATSPEIVAERNLYLEVWCVEAVAQAINQLHGIKRWLSPRLCPFVCVEQDGLHIASKGGISLPEYQLAILRACDGRHAACTIASQAAQHWPELKDEQDVYDFLEVMESSGLLMWALDVPMQLRPEKSLREQLLQIQDESLRTRALGMLAQLENKTEAVRRAAGDPERLDSSLSDLEDTFKQLTGREAVRSHGQTYAARTLVYEDCRRALDLELGQDILSTLGPPLTLMLASARWFTHEAEARAREAFDLIYDQLCAANNGCEVDLLSFIEASRPLIFDKERGLAPPITSLFQQKWATLLQLPRDERRVHYRSEQLRDRVQQVFHAVRPGWRLARYHSPDLLISASSPEAICQGDYLFVMGELHLAMNTVGQNLFIAQHPSPDELQAAARHDIPGPAFVSIVSKASTYLTSARLMPALLCEKDYRLHYDSDWPDDRPAPLLRGGNLVVIREQGRLFVTARDASCRFDLLDVMAELLGVAISDGFRMLAPQLHSPRITIDRLVVSRECWTVPVAQAEFAHEKSSLARFKTVRRWASSLRLPRFLFVKFPSEDKPFYLDLESPVYIDIFCRLVRQAMVNQSEMLMTVTEMLPAHGQIWLPDYAGETYTSELRMVALDLAS